MITHLITAPRVSVRPYCAFCAGPCRHAGHVIPRWLGALKLWQCAVVFVSAVTVLVFSTSLWLGLGW